MRYLVYALILANLVVFLWFQREAPAPPAPLPAAVPRLVLLGDAPPDPVASSPATGTDERPAREPDRPAPDAAPRPETRAAVPPAAAAPAPPVCYRLGPFAERAAAVRAARAFDGAAARTTVVAEPVPIVRYLVHLPPMPPAQAARTVAAVREAGIEEWFLGRTYFISFGLYDRRAMAERRRAALARAGFDTDIKPLEERLSRYWLRLAVPEGAAADPRRSPPAGLRIESLACGSGD